VTRPESLTYAVDDVPPLAKLVLLGLQQTLVIAIYLVMAAVIVRAARAPAAVAQSAISLGMLALAVAAVLQALWKGPVGSGYLAPSVISAVYLHPSLTALTVGGLPLVFGMTVFAGLCEIGLSRLLPHLRAMFPTVVCGFIVMAVGIELGLIGARQVLDVDTHLTGKGLSLHIAVAGLTLMTMISLAIWGRGLIRLLSSMLGLLLGCIVALGLGFVHPEALRSIREAPVVGVPGLDHIAYVFQWTVVVPFMIAALAAGLRTVGVITTCQRINDASWKRPNQRSIAGGVLADGLGCAIGGALGVMGMAASPSAVGISQATGATSRYVAFAIAGWFVLFAAMPKLAACFLALPDSVVGATLMFTGSMMLVSGIQIVAAGPLDTRKTMVVGVSLLLGLSHETFPTFYQTLPYGLRVVTGSMLSIATISSVALNLLFRLGIRKTSTITIETDQDSLTRFESLVHQQGKSWGVASEILEEASATAERALQLIEESHLADGAITARISSDEVRFLVDIQYSGDLLHLPARRPTTDEDMLEERPMAHGLSGFLAEVYPDRIRYWSDDERCHIQLAFEL
jgi:NCS2 family nucleobase:cation symporter-2